MIFGFGEDVKCTSAISILLLSGGLDHLALAMWAVRPPARWGAMSNVTGASGTEEGSLS